jgi:penicillin-binding protein 1A
MSWKPERERKLPAWLDRIPPKWRKCLRILSIFFGIGFLAFACFCFYYLSLASSYDIKEVGQLQKRNVVYDKNGEEMDAIVGSNIEQITFADLPPFLVKCLQAREDRDFFEHGGVDTRGLLRATLRNIVDRKFTQGASTLSMQLARNTFNIRAKSLNRKFLEIALTLRLEQHYSKEEIMAGYLNRIYFGVGASHLGIQDAARNYFGKSVTELHEGECAMLIGIIRGPHIFSPWRNREAAEQQRNQVLLRMNFYQFINDAEMQRIIDLPIKLIAKSDASSEQSYAVQAVVKEVDKILSEEDIQRGGLKIRTTLDMQWQKRLENELQSSLALLEAERDYLSPTHLKHVPGTEPEYLQLAAITLETNTGAILSQISGRDFQHSRLDRCRTLRRDLGSAFEPFVAAAAAQRRRAVIPGSPVATGRSVGIDSVTRIAKRCGLTGPFAETEDLFRGVVSATPMEMAIGLSTLAHKGNRATPYLIQEIRNADDEIIYQADHSFFPALSARAATEAMSVLSQNKATETFTGATGSEREAWLLRVGPRGSTAIWIGFDKPGVITHEQRLKKLLLQITTRLDNR